MQEQMLTTVKKIQRMYLPATNTEESAKWYTEYLGLKPLRPVDENQAQLSISRFEQTIFLIKSKEAINVNYDPAGNKIEIWSSWPQS